IVGDWGTGIERAKKVAHEMRVVIEQGAKDGLQQHVIHLGDVYYSGWKREYENRFLRYWPVDIAEGRTIASWCLNGNHDMYSGGHAYYDYLLADPRFTRQEQSSFFSLSNDHWEVLALDSSWEDGGLEGIQGDWALAKLNESKRKVMLLSHHQA